MGPKLLIQILIHFLYINLASADCNTVYPGLPTFMNYKYRCHCANDDLCDSQTGYCSSGCALGWMGPGCQYRNIAIYKSNIQSIDGIGASTGLAVDGNALTCSETNPASTTGQHWFMIEWSRDYLIKGLVLKIHSDNLGNFPNFVVETGVGPNNSRLNNICYEHTNSSVLAEMEIMCRHPVRSKHIRVKVSIPNVSLRLCEVEIYGGRVTSFNKETNQISTYEQFTSSKSVDGHDLSNFTGVDIEKATEETCSATGVSDDNPWWLVDLGQSFEIQDIYFYGRRDIVGQFKGFIMLVGKSSELTRQEIFKDTKTDPKASDYQPMRTMLDEIKTGRFVKIKRELVNNILTICEVFVFAECPINSCGWDCTLKCFCKRDMTGHMKIAGFCPDGCLSGWTGVNSKCDSECTNGTFGINCAERCGYCKEGNVCDRFNGHCKDGCSAGYIGIRCIDKCDDGWFGNNCSRRCGFCKDQVSCNHITGHCPGGCQPGYLGSTCTDVCRNQTYGINCSEICGHCLNSATCNYTNGFCKTGCEKGWQGDKCINECDVGKYGQNCREMCGNCYKMSDCNTYNGICKTGCAAGWNGSRCEKHCDNGTYGLGCKYTCGNCQTKYCIHTTGACPMGCSEGYEGTMCTLKVSRTSASPAGTIVGLIFGVTVMVVAIILGILYFLRRKRNRSSGESEGKAENILTNTRVSKTKESLKSETSDRNIPTQETFTPGNIDKRGVTSAIQLSHLRSFCQSSKMSPTSLYAEFKALPYGLQFDVSEAKRSRYKSKNRYKDIYPYNANRVILPEIDGDDASTYINASYIDGYQSPKKYIAAQGALKDTVDDIWRMVWSQDIRIIVMLTGCYEQGQMKCIQYWPDEGSKEYNEICVNTSEVETYSDFTRRIFYCYKLDIKERRTVLQYHFTGWPDKDVPDTALSLAQFWRAVRKSDSYTEKTTLLVHCSAGVGRTGTFIALDYLYDQGFDKEKVDVESAVRKLRDQRVNMVQTQGQYMYLHEVLAEILDPIGFVCNTNDFNDTCYSILSSEDVLLQEYKKIGDSMFRKPGREPGEEVVYGNLSKRQLTDAQLIENIHKSRNPEIYPLDIHRPRLGLNVDSRNDLINAVFIKTFRQRDRMILTQVPVEDAVVDFIRMVWEFDVQTIILLEENIDHGLEYWPSDNAALCIGPFNSELLQEEIKFSYVIRTIRYCLEGKTENKVVRQLHLKSWPGETETPNDIESVLSLIADIDYVITDNPKIIAIHCNDGAKKSGVVCVLISLFERMKTDGEVAIAETVRMIKQRRPQIINSFDQYKFCHRAVQNYLESQDVYANVL